MKTCEFFFILRKTTSTHNNVLVLFLFVVTAAGVVPCGSPKKRPRTSSTVQFIFYFWSFEIGRLKYSEKSEKIVCLDSYVLNSLSSLDTIWIYISHYMTSLLKLEITVCFLAFIASSFWVNEED